MVMATQNPIEYEGTYPLPEAQLDRFTLRLRIGYPPLSEEAQMLTEQTPTEPPSRPRAGDDCRRGGRPDRRREDASTSRRA